VDCGLGVGHWGTGYQQAVDKVTGAHSLLSMGVGSGRREREKGASRVTMTSQCVRDDLARFGASSNLSQADDDDDDDDDDGYGKIRCSCISLGTT
jgi:hypothetical protein